MVSVRVERSGQVAIARLNRPDAGNALDAETIAELFAAIDDAGADPDVRGLVLTGAGRIFCAGGDIGMLDQWRRLDLPGRTAKYDHSQGLVRALQACPVPVVAALNGSAAGAGTDLALACDLRVAASGASLSAGFAAVGLVPDLGGSWFLAQRLGRLEALRFLLAGSRLSADRAAELGLIDQVVPGEDLLAGACDLIGELTASASREVVTETLLALRGAHQHDLEASLGRAASVQARLMSTPDHQERVAAFLARAR